MVHQYDTMATVTPATMIIVMGVSGSGKDTAFTLLKGLLEYQGRSVVNLKFTRGGGIKDVLERIYEIPSGSLDDPLFKSLAVPGHPLGYTYQEVLIKTWELLPQIDPTVFIRKAGDRIREALALGDIPIFTDVRYFAEVELIQKILKEHPSCQLLTIRLTRSDAQPKASDANCSELTLRLAQAGSLAMVSNNTTLYDLEGKLRNVLSELSLLPQQLPSLSVHGS